MPTSPHTNEPSRAFRDHVLSRGGFGERVLSARKPRQLARFYRRMLLDDIMPWWRRHAVDDELGGILSCVDDDGTIRSRDKYIWSQVRALWTFSAVSNRVRKDAEELAIADTLFERLRRHGRSSDGDWLFVVTQDWRPKEGARSIQTDAFAICALIEYARARSSDSAVALANDTFRRSWAKIQLPGSYETAPYPIPSGTKAHRVSMQFSLAYWELFKLTGDPHVREAAWLLSQDVLDHFRRPELQIGVEYLNLNNTLASPPAGTYFSGGHGVETAWFQIENLRHTGDRGRLAQACELMRWSLERGWDGEYGGLLLGGDLSGGPPFLPNADVKAWWPHCESLCGTLLAFEVSGEEWCRAWHDRVLAWSLAHFPVPEHGEWRQRLDRTGRPLNRFVALPVKDPFHLPRALVYALEALERTHPYLKGTA